MNDTTATTTSATTAATAKNGQTVDARQRTTARAWLVGLLAANLADLLTTILVLRVGGTEANALPALIARHYAVPGLIALKAAGVAAMCALLLLGWMPAKTQRATRASRKLVIWQLRAYTAALAIIAAANVIAAISAASQ